jgi:dUTP diphosphatase
MELKVQLLSTDAKLPQRATPGSAGYDLYSPLNVLIPAGESSLIPLNICISIPPSCYGRIAPRSGLAWRNVIDVLGGIIDKDYGLEIKAILINHGAVDFQVNKGDRIAQLILERCETPPIVEVNNIYDTSRGGFGSTGK